MNYLVLLDAGPLGMVMNPRESAENRECKNWLKTLLAAGVRVMIPEGADYEVRRELIRAGRTKGIARLDLLAEQIGYVPVTLAIFRRAAEIWAEIRKSGTPTAHDKALDFDVLLGAQAQVAAQSESLNVVVATTNVGHLVRFTDAREWQRIETTPIDRDFVRELNFFGGATLERITNQTIDVMISTSPTEMTSAELCKSFVKDGRLWIDMIPGLNRKYVAPMPRDAIIGRNESELSVGRFVVVISRSSEAGILLLQILETKKRGS